MSMIITLGVGGAKGDKGDPGPPGPHSRKPGFVGMPILHIRSQLLLNHFI